MTAQVNMNLQSSEHFLLTKEGFAWSIALLFNLLIDDKIAIRLLTQSTFFPRWRIFLNVLQ